MEEHANGAPTGTHMFVAILMAALIPLIATWAALGVRSAGASDVPTKVIITICNDGIVSQGEVCDQGAGNNIGTYGSSTAERVCAPGCLSFGPYCGDGILQVRFGEECDDGNNTSGDLCSVTCTAETPAPPPGSPSRGSTPDVPGAAPGTILSEKETRIVLKGKAFPASAITILLDGKTLGIAQTDTNADFLFSTAAVNPGTVTFGFVGKDASGVQSVTTSVVFEVVQSAITTVANIFLPPTIKVSSTKLGVGEPLTISGRTVPRAAVSIVIGPGDTKPYTATADQSGAWSLQVDTASLSKGVHTVKASFSLSALVKSGYGKAVSFSVGSGQPGEAASSDLNGDGNVNLVDFSIFLLAWNTHDARSDFNGDGIVNLADFSIMLFAWTG